jgi:arylsulfatase A-like enzyme
VSRGAAWWTLGVMALGVVALAGCRPDCTPATQATAPVVVLVTVDTLRADHLGSYGSPRVRTPHMDRLATEGARFARTWSASNATLPSHASIFTSATLVRHGVRSNRPGPPEKLPTLPGTLHAAGYETAGFVSAYHVGPKMVFGTMLPELDPFVAPRRVSRPERAETTVNETLAWMKGACRGPAFAWVHLWDPHMPYAPPAPWNGTYYTGDPRAATHTSLADAEFDWALHDMTPATARLRRMPGLLKRVKRTLGVGSRMARRLVLWPNELKARSPDDATYRELYGALRPVLADLHRTLPFNDNVAGMLTGVRDLEYPRGLYAGEVSYVDAELGRLVTTLESWGLRDRLVVVVTADHGEGLGEHAIYCNHIGVWEEMLRVPLIVWAPGRVTPAVRDDLASGLDVAPTLLRLLGVTVPSTMEGHDLLGGGPPRRELVTESLLHFQLALTDGRWKLVRTLRDYYATTRFYREAGDVELYDLAHDPGEQSNLATSEPERTADLQTRLAAWMIAHGVGIEAAPAPAVSPADRDRLRALGYVD